MRMQIHHVVVGVSTYCKCSSIGAQDVNKKTKVILDTYKYELTLDSNLQDGSFNPVGSSAYRRFLLAWANWAPFREPGSARISRIFGPFGFVFGG
jgi:hypothetical protein